MFCLRLKLSPAIAESSVHTESKGGDVANTTLLLTSMSFTVVALAKI